MNNGNGGQQLTDEEKRQRTATNIARKKVLESYKLAPQNYKLVEPDVQGTSPSRGVSEISPEEWKQYHTAWQNYYQNYYGQYYGRAANDYVAREKLRMRREQDAANAKFAAAPTAAKGARQDSLNSDPRGVISSSPYDPAIDVQQSYRERIREKAAKRARKNKKKRAIPLWPLALGGSIAACGVLLQYNQVIVGNVMAYMSPGNGSVNEISVVDPTVTVAVHSTPTLMIPKLNVEVPVTFGAGNSVDEMAVAMNDGVAHFAVNGASSLPGQLGNFVVSGHSSGNVYEHSPYKFIFSGLSRMQQDDKIYMDYNGVRYTYKMTGSIVVDPSDVEALRKIARENEGKPMITLVTCTPVGTSKYRLLVYAEQIYPSYDGAPLPEDLKPVVPGTPEKPHVGGYDITSLQMPKNSDSPFKSLWRKFTEK